MTINYWSKCKQEIVSIICLSLMQIWWSVNFPVFVRFGLPWYPVLACASSIVGIAIIVGMFSCAHEYAHYVTLNHLDDVQVGGLPLKQASRALVVVMLLFGIFFAWFCNLFSVQSIFYGVQLVFVFLGYALFYIATQRAPLS